MKSKKIFWVFIGNEITASSRIHGYRIHEKLLSLGFNSNILFSPLDWFNKYPFTPKAEAFIVNNLQIDDILIVQKIKDESFISFFKKLKKRGVKIVFIDSDLPVANSYKEYVDLVICPSKYFKHQYKINGFQNVCYIPDCPEEFIEKSDYKLSYKCVWFGGGGEQKWREALMAQEIFDERKTKWTLSTVSSHEDACIKWTEDSLVTISKFDVAVIPIDLENRNNYVKSSNRVLQAMALGLPVFTNPIPSYSEILLNGENGYIGDNDSFINELQQLEDENTYRKMSQKAYQTAKNYSINKVINEWISFLGIDENYKTFSKSDNNDFLRIVYKELSFLNRNYFPKYLKFEKLFLNKMKIFIITYSFVIKRRIGNLKLCTAK